MNGLLTYVSGAFSMYVCLCKGVSERQIKEVISQGHGDFRQIRCQTGLGTQCGVCRKSVKQYLNQIQATAVETKAVCES